MDLIGTIESTFSRVNATVFRQVNRAANWWDLPTPVALLNLRAHRDDLRRHNLYDTAAPRDERRRDAAEELPPYRTYDGSLPGPCRPARWGWSGSRFGRNAPTDATAPEPPPERLLPSPREVANRLLLRDEFKPATTPQRARRLLDPVPEPRLVRPRRERARRPTSTSPLAEGDEWPEGTPMRVRATSPDRTRTYKSGCRRPTSTPSPTGGTRSQIYGSTEERNRELRAGADGKLDRSRTGCSRMRPTRSSTAST